MEKNNAKQVTKMLLATCFVMVIIAGGAYAASIILSNNLHDEVVVQDHAAVLSWDPQLPENVVTNITYDCGVRLEGNEDANVIVKFVIARAGIEAGDVTVEYFDGTIYVPLSMTDTGGTLEGEFGPVGGFPISAGYDETTLIQVTFSEGGSYSTDLWVEAR